MGGKWQEYVDIHDLMDSSKKAFGDNRHRALTHNAWFVGEIIEKVFGHTRLNSDGKVYCTRDVAEQHCAEDFKGFIPTACDFLQSMDAEPWMNNGAGTPPSRRKFNGKSDTD